MSRDTLLSEGINFNQRKHTFKIYEGGNGKLKVIFLLAGRRIKLYDATIRRKQAIPNLLSKELFRSGTPVQEFFFPDTTPSGE